TPFPQSHLSVSSCPSPPQLYTPSLHDALPISGGAISEPAWRSKPSWYLVTTDDRMIPPSLQREMSERAGSTVEPARSDISRCSDGGIIRSSVVTRYQLGLLRHAGSLIAPPEIGRASCREGV